QQAAQTPPPGQPPTPPPGQPVGQSPADAAPTHPATAHAAPSPAPIGFGPAQPTADHAATPPPGQPQAPAPHPYTHPVVGASPYGPHHTPVPGQAPAPVPPPKKKSRAGLIALAAVVAFAVAGGGTAYFLLKENGKTTNQSQGDKNSATPRTPTPSPDGGATGGSQDPGTGTGADAGTSGGTPTDGGGAPATPPTPVEYKGIDLTETYELSLADDPVKPKEEGGDLHYGISGLSTSSSGGRLVLLRNGQPGTLDTCLSETRYTTSIEHSQMSKGSRICLQNGAGDVALISVLGFSPESDPSDYISLDLTVWRGATDVEQSS
ncbi:serine/threonine protein kinase, partial [Streptomyces coeruleoprunus]